MLLTSERRRASFLSLCSLLLVSTCFVLIDAEDVDDYIVSATGDLTRGDPSSFDSNVLFRPPSSSESGESPCQSFSDWQRAYAIKPILRGDTIITMKYDHIVTYATVSEDVPRLGNEQFYFPEEPFVLWLLYQYSLKEYSPYLEFIQSLPERIQTPLLFTTDDWSQYTDPLSARFHAQSVETTELLRQYHEKHADTLFHKDSLLFPPEYFTFQRYLQAFAVVVKYSRTLPNGQLALFPKLHFSHDPLSSTLLHLNDDGQFEITADRDYAVGDEVFINFGNVTNEELAFRQGVYVRNNAFDCVPVRVSNVSVFWSLITPIMYNATGVSSYASCVAADFQPSSAIIVDFRLLVASATDLNHFAEIRKGQPINLANELRAIRLLYYSVYVNSITVPTNNTELAPHLVLWSAFLRNQETVVSSVLSRLVSLWQLYLNSSLE